MHSCIHTYMLAHNARDCVPAANPFVIMHQPTQRLPTLQESTSLPAMAAPTPGIGTTVGCSHFYACAWIRIRVFIISVYVFVGVHFTFSTMCSIVTPLLECMSSLSYPHTCTICVACLCAWVCSCTRSTTQQDRRTAPH
jgi:hypothetical protein